MSFGPRGIRFPVLMVAVPCMAILLGGQPAAGADDATFNASGTWQSSADGTQPGTWKAVLNQNGQHLSGTMTVSGSAAVSNAAIDGVMEDGQISVGIAQNHTNWAYFRGTVDGAALTGTYTFSAFTDSGTWSGTMSAAADTSASAQ